MNLFQMQLLYLVGVTITVITLCIYNGIALARANRKRLRTVQVLLLPSLVGNSLSIIAFLIQDYHFIMGTRETMPEYIVALCLPLLSGWLFIYGISRLCSIIADIPASKSDDQTDIDLSQKDTWPPPPNKPAV